jgi:hypothetical protein
MGRKVGMRDNDEICYGSETSNDDGIRRRDGVYTNDGLWQNWLTVMWDGKTENRFGAAIQLRT